METEYIQWRAFRSVVQCMKTDIKLSSGGSERDVSDRIFHSEQINFTTGVVYAATVGGDHRAKITCGALDGPEGIVQHALQHIGIGSIRELVAILKENSSNAEEINKAQATIALNKYMEDHGYGGKGRDGVGDLSEAARFWYWDRVYRAGLDGELNLQTAGAAGTVNCRGIFTDDGLKDGTQVYSPNNKFNYFRQTDDGRFEAADYNYAFYGVSEGTNLKWLDGLVQIDSGGNNPTCIQAARQLTPTRRNLYIGRLNAYLDANPDASIDLGASGADAAGGPAPASCESEGGDMSWILCPLLEYLDKAIVKIDNVLTDLLMVPNNYVESDGLRNAWSNLRNLAYIILVPITLVMVIGTAMGFDFINAYTVKRAMPRLIIAAIFIALSYELTKFLVILTNEVGNGMYGLITNAVTGGEKITLTSIFNANVANDATALLSGIGLLVGGLAIGSIGILLSYMFVMLLGLAMGFFLLTLRQVLIIALMILAPLAILSWIFPGNDKLWKLWWGTFSKLLLLFPMIMILLAVGRSFAYIIAGVSN